MTPNEQGDFCGLCCKQVYDLSKMTASEARAFLQQRPAGQSTCVRYVVSGKSVRFRPATVAQRVGQAATLAMALGMGGEPRSVTEQLPQVAERQMVGELPPMPPEAPEVVDVAEDATAVERIVKGRLG